MRRVVLLVLVMVLWALPAAAATYYVDKDAVGGYACNNANPGTLTLPVCSLVKGVELLSAAGDILDIRAGTYAEAIHFQTTPGKIPSGTGWGAGQVITMQGHVGETVTIDRIDVNTSAGAGGGTLQYVLFTNLHMQRAYIGGPGTAHIKLEDSELSYASGGAQGLQGYFADDIQIRRVRLHHVQSAGVAGDQDEHGVYMGNTNLLIEDSEIYSNDGYGIQIYNSNPGGQGSTTNTTIRRNRIYSNGTGNECKSGITVNHGTGIQVYNNLIYDNCGGGIQASYGEVEALLAHNTVYNNGATGISTFVGAGSVQVVNNVVVAAADRIRNDNGTATTFTNNWCNAADTGCTYTGSPGLNTNLASADFLKPLASSGVQNKGTAVTYVPADPTDFTGVTQRTSPVDLGAYEYVIAGVDPVVQIAVPAANPYTSPTATVSVSGTATDGDGDGTLNAVTFTCQQLNGGTCTPTSGNANGTATNWSLPTLTLSSGTQAVVTVTATDTTGRSGSAARTISYTAGTACTHYASPSGSGGSGCTNANGPYCALQSWVDAPPSPGQTLCLRDGTYAEVQTPANFAGTSGSGQRITIRALNEGQVLIRGTFPVWLNGSYGILEGVNVEGLDGEWTIGLRGDHWIVRRVIAWTTAGTENYAGWSVAGTNNLIEDCAAFGNTRNPFAMGSVSSNPDRNNTARRCWVRYENRVPGQSPRVGLQVGYFQSSATAENMLATWDEVNNANTDGEYTSPLYLNHSHSNKILGSIIYETATANWWGGALTYSQSDTQYGDTLYGTRFTDLVAIIAPSHPSFSNGTGFDLWECMDGVCGSDNVATNLVSVGGSPPYCGWTHNGSSCGTIRHGSSLAAALQGTGNTVWEQVPGICKRYIDGSLTGAALWPWPMNQRIKDALRTSGRAEVDVTQTIYALLGAPPATCTTDSTTPVATRLLVGQQPSPVIATQTMIPPVTIQVRDENNALYTDAPVSVSLALTVPAGALLSGPGCSASVCTTQSTSGTATFSNLVIDLPGTYTLTATASSLPQPTVTTSPFVVSALPSVATALVITQQATTALVSTALTPPLLVEVRDQNNAVFTASPVTVTISKASGAGTLGGDLSNATVNGVATFSDLTLSAAATVTLTASFTTGTADDATSAAIVVSEVPAAATSLAFASVPASVHEDTMFTATVQVMDQYGAVYDPNPEIEVTITKTAGGGTLTGGGPVTTVAGLATFSTLTLDTQPTTATLQAASGGLTMATAQVDVGPAPLVPTHVAFGAQPQSTYAGYTLAPVTVRLLTAQDALVTDDSATVITLTLTNNEEGATLLGDLTQAVTAGVATFSDLRSLTPGTYTLTASYTAGGADDAVSASFTLQLAPLPQAYLRWQLNEGVGVSLAADTGIVPQRYVGTITGASWVAGHRQANSLSFVASEQDTVANANVSWPAQSPVTVVAWVKVPDNTGGGLFHVGAANDQVQTFGAHIASTDGKLYWNYGPLTSGGVLAWDWPADGSLYNQWLRIVLTASGSTGQSKAIYVNGQLQKSNMDLSASAAPTTTLTGLTLGMHSPYTPAIYLNGQVEDFALYDVQWDAAQVLVDYQGAVPPLVGGHPSGMMLGR